MNIESSAQVEKVFSESNSPYLRAHAQVATNYLNEMEKSHPERVKKARQHAASTRLEYDVVGQMIPVSSAQVAKEFLKELDK